MVLAMAWPCAGPRSNVRRISRSRVPCSSSMRSFCSLVDILGENRSLPVECQGELLYDESRVDACSEVIAGADVSPHGETYGRYSDTTPVGDTRLWTAIVLCCVHSGAEHIDFFRILLESSSMGQPQFVYLHVHTDYSLLDGACETTELLDEASRLKMPAVAITDHGNLFAAANFFYEASKRDVKPIIGCEVYVAKGSRHDHGEKTNAG